MDKARSVDLISCSMGLDWADTHVCATMTTTPSKHIFSHAIARTPHIFYHSAWKNKPHDGVCKCALILGIISTDAYSKSCFISILRCFLETFRKFPNTVPFYGCNAILVTFE
jgi:hypothetical protein